MNLTDDDICPKCERAVQGNRVFCRICTGEHGGGNDNDGPPNGERPESTVEAPGPNIETPGNQANGENAVLI